MANKTALEIRFNPPDLLQRLSSYPARLDTEMSRTVDAALLHVLGSVPPYPPQNPNSTYERTGTLGRSIGLEGSPDVRTIKKLGAGKYEGRIGSRLYYAPYVIGEETQARKVRLSANWWTTKTIAEKAQPGIIKLFNAMAERLASWIDGQ